MPKSVPHHVRPRAGSKKYGAWATHAPSAMLFGPHVEGTGTQNLRHVCMALKTATFTNWGVTVPPFNVGHKSLYFCLNLGISSIISQQAFIWHLLNPRYCARWYRTGKAKVERAPSFSPPGGLIEKNSTSANQCTSV